MSGVNKVILVGNLGANPELRYTQGQQAVANLRIATTEKWTDKNGQKQEATEWHRVVVWGRQAEIALLSGITSSPIDGGGDPFEQPASARTTPRMPNERMAGTLLLVTRCVAPPGPLAGCPAEARGAAGCSSSHQTAVAGRTWS